MPNPQSFPTRPKYPMPCTHWDSDGDRRADLAVDIQAPEGTEALAVFAGTARVYHTVLGGWTVGITHVDGTIAHYGHLKDVIVGDGSQVLAGQVIGHTGNTGTLSNGAHLHFAVGVTIRPDNGEGTIHPCDWLGDIGPAGGALGSVGAQIQQLPWKLIGIGAIVLVLLDD